MYKYELTAYSRKKGEREIIGIADTLTEARLRAIRLLKKGNVARSPDSEFPTISIGVAGWRFIEGDVAVKRNGKALWLTGGNTVHVIYTNGRIGPARRFFDSDLDKW